MNHLTAQVRKPLGVEQAGANMWAVSADLDEELTVYTLLEGPGIAGVVAARLCGGER